MVLALSNESVDLMPMASLMRDRFFLRPWPKVWMIRIGAPRRLGKGHAICYLLSAAVVPTTALSQGELVPALGQGTWGMAEGKHPMSEEISALRTGLDLGMTLIDTAGMYADGGAEQLVGNPLTEDATKSFS
jgi:aldo/keto reductase family protein